MWCKKPAIPDDVSYQPCYIEQLNQQWNCFGSVSKLFAKLLVLSLRPTAQATHRDCLSHAPSVSTHTHAHRMHMLTWALLFPRALCTLSCAVSYWHFSGTLLYFLISFPTIVFSLFHNWTFASPSISKKHLIWFLPYGQQPRRLKNLFLTCHINTSASRYISVLLVLQNSAEPFPSVMLYFPTIYIIIYTWTTSMDRMFFALCIDFYCTVATEEPETSSCCLLCTQKDKHPELQVNFSFTVCHNYLPVQSHYLSFSMFRQHSV